MKIRSIAESGQLSFFRRRYLMRLKFFRGVVSSIPLADLILMIILYLIIHSWVILRPGIALDLPVVEFIDGARAGTPLITVVGESQVFMNDQRTSLTQLPEALQAQLQEQPDRTVVIQADRRAHHETVLRVYAAAHAAGYERVILATQMPATDEGPP